MTAEFLYCAEAVSEQHSEPQQRSAHAPVFVVLHGLLGTSGNVRSLEKALAPRGYALFYDLPNHGKSPTLDPCTFIDMANMLHATLARDVFSDAARHPAAAVHLIGHSLGGKLAAVYALLHPAQVAALAVLDIAPVEYPPLHAAELQALENVVAAAEADAAFTSEQARAIIAGRIADPLMVGFLMKNVYADEGGRTAVYARARALRANYDALRSFPHDALAGAYFAGPALFVRGAKSDYVTPAHYPHIERYFPAWELEEVDAGHVVHAEKPAEVRELLAQFYDQHITA